MKGAVAAGHPLTAQAGARVLEEGGNAVDACVAAGVRRRGHRELPDRARGGWLHARAPCARPDGTRLADFFVAAPGLGLGGGGSGEMQVIDVGFGDSTTTQPFRIGPASVAVPGAVAGLEAAHRAYGRLPWRELLAPGDRARPRRRRAHAPAGAHARDARPDPAGRRRGRTDLQQPERFASRRRRHCFASPTSADTLEAIGRRGAAVVSRGERARAMVATVREGGGELTLDDLAALPRHLAASRARALPRARGALESGPVVRRRADRLRAGAPSGPAGDSGGQRRGGRCARRGDARAGARARGAGSSRAASIAAGLQGGCSTQPSCGPAGGGSRRACRASRSRRRPAGRRTSP